MYSIYLRMCQQVFIDKKKSTLKKSPVKKTGIPVRPYLTLFSG